MCNRVDQTVRKLLKDHISGENELLQYLVEIQQIAGYIPASTCTQLAAQLSIPISHIRGVINFYSFLFAEPRGKYRILFSDNITDRMSGSGPLLARLCEQLNIQPHQFKPDQIAYVSTTSCTGLCDQGPALLINNHAITRLDTQRIDEISRLIQSGKLLEDWPQELFFVDNEVLQKGLILDSSYRPGDALAAIEKKSAKSFLQELEQSGLRGRGGAGYPVWKKWSQCAAVLADAKTVVCNADEGEPGTYKDRVLLARYAEDMIEGMTICAIVVGAQQGFIYLRGEYRFLLVELENCLERRRQKGLLGQKIRNNPVWNFDIRIHLGAGAYVCGEESALLESLEGKRGIPRVRPPYPTQSGYCGTPTVVNNVETFLAATRIAQNGGKWFCSQGTKDSTGSRLLSVSGDCARPGVYEVANGISIREVLTLCEAEDTQAVQVAGAAGMTIGPDEFDRTIAFEDIATGGSFMVFDHSRDLLNTVLNFTDFFVHESCGFCTPCRVGGKLLRDTVTKFRENKASRNDIGELRVIADTLQKTAFCGLGHTAPNPVLDTLDKFPHIYESRLQDSDNNPEFDLQSEVSEARALVSKGQPS